MMPGMPNMPNMPGMPNVPRPGMPNVQLPGMAPMPGMQVPGNGQPPDKNLFEGIELISWQWPKTRQRHCSKSASRKKAPWLAARTARRR